MQCNVHFQLRTVPPFQCNANGKVRYTTQPIVKGRAGSGHESRGGPSPKRILSLLDVPRTHTHGSHDALPHLGHNCTAVDTLLAVARVLYKDENEFVHLGSANCSVH